MGSLVHKIAALTAARYGVNILEEVPPGGVRGVGTNVVAVVGHFPWGPVDTVTDITSNGELFDAFAPLPFDVLDDWASLKAFLNKTFPNTVKVVRISPTAAAAATKTFNDAESSPAASVTVTARYAGSVGNQITVAWTANADDATARDATVAIGTKYSATYEAVATMVGSALVVTDPGDPYVAFSKAASATKVPAAAAATALATGADGTPAAGDYTAALEVLADASVEFNVGFVAEPPADILEDVNEAIKAFVDEHDKGFWVPCTPASQTSSAAQAYMATLRTDRFLYPWPRVKTVNGFDPDREEITVDGAAFAACAIANVQPEISPGGAPGAPYLRGITGLEQGASLTTLNALNAAGVSPFFMSTALEGAILHNAVTTSLTPGLTKVFRRRMTDYIVSLLSGILERYVGQPLDIDLENQALGPVTGPEMGEVRAALEGLANPSRQRIREYAIDEFSQNTSAGIAEGQWVILTEVGLFAAQEKIVLLARIGEGVEITEAT